MKRENGQTIVEYALIIAIVVLLLTPPTVFLCNVFISYMEAVQAKVEEAP